MFKDNIVHFLNEGRGWFPKKIPASILAKIEVTKPGVEVKGKPGPVPTEKSLRVMSYNILAPSLVAKVDYGNTNKEHIMWENRLL